MAEHRYYLTCDRDKEKGGFIAVITRGDANITVLDVERVKNPKEAKRWFRRMLVEKPWETRQ